MKRHAYTGQPAALGFPTKLTQHSCMIIRHTSGATFSLTQSTAENICWNDIYHLFIRYRNGHNSCHTKGETKLKKKCLTSHTELWKAYTRENMCLFSCMYETQNTAPSKSDGNQLNRLKSTYVCITFTYNLSTKCCHLILLKKNICMCVITHCGTHWNLCM